MRFSKTNLCLTVFICGLFLISSQIMGTEAIDVGKIIKKRINANPALKAQLIKRIFNEDVNGNDYRVTLFEVGLMNQVSAPRINLEGLPAVWKFVTAKEVINCTGDPVSKSFTLSGTTKSSKTINKTMNFSMSYSGTVGVQFEIVSASVTSTWTAGYTQSWSDTEEESHTAEDTTQVQMNEKGGRVYTLTAKHLVGDIPYEAVYEIDDESPIQIEFKGKNGHIFVYQHINFQGNGNRYELGARVPELTGSMNNCISSIKVQGGVRGILFGLKNYKGKSKVFVRDRNWVGDDINDKTTSLQVKPRFFRRIHPTLPFKEIKDLIPFNDRRFVAKGSLAVDYCYPSPVTLVTIDYLSDDYIQNACGTSGGGYQAGLPGTSVKTKTLTQAQLDRLRNSGKIK